MEIYFATKQENNKRREEEFLKLSPGERLLSFIDWVCTPSIHPLPEDYVHPNDKKGNFILRKRMGHNFNDEVYQFITACNKYSVKMLLVGGSAVNYYGYKRHSADIDFWINPSTKNLKNFLKALQQISYLFDRFPDDVISGKQNISLKFSPDLELELITRFNPGKTFEQAYKESVKFNAEGQDLLKWNIISYESLINSKIKSARPKDLLDIKELQRINKKE